MLLVDGVVQCSGHLSQFAGNRAFQVFAVLDIIAVTAFIMVIYSDFYKVSVGVTLSLQNVLFL
jgi:hypothetical protein